MTGIRETFSNGCRRVDVLVFRSGVRPLNAALVLLGVLCLLHGVDSTADAQVGGLAAAGGGGAPAGGLLAAGGGFQSFGYASSACSRLLGYIQGGFGTLVTTCAGLRAIVAAAVGGFKAAWCLLVVSIGVFILRSYLTLFMTPC